MSKQEKKIRHNSSAFFKCVNISLTDFGKIMQVFKFINDPSIICRGRQVPDSDIPFKTKMNILV